MCRRCPPPPHSSRASSVTNSSQFWKNLFCTCNNPNGKNVCEVCNFLFVLEMSVCFRVFVELDYLPACKILIAHCIYEGSLKTWSLRPDEKCFSIWNPSQRADAVSTVLCVSVVNELPDIQFFSSCPPPNLLTRLTKGSNRKHQTTMAQQFCGTVRPCCKTLDYFFFPHCLVNCRFCMPSYNVKWFPFGEVSW